MPWYYDPSLYNITHEKNKIIIQAQKLETIYNNPNAPTTRQPRVNLTFVLRQQLVPENTARLSRTDGLRFDQLLRRFNQPLRALTANPGPAVAAMFSRLDLPFELMGPESSSGRVFWFHRAERAYALVEGMDDVAEMIRSSVERMVVEEGGPAAVKSLKIGVSIWKRTAVDTELYDSLYDDQEVNEVGLQEDEDSANDDGGFEAEEFLETVAYGEVESSCSACVICTDEFLSSTHVARLPCSHVFHGECVVPWLQMKRTCPLCRFRLVNN